MLVVGFDGTELGAHERALLAAPEISGVILFARNFRSRAQVTDLVDALRALRGEHFLVSVDQEGGPVQRFREGFTRLPALARIGALYDRDPAAAIARAEEHAWVMASEMRALDVDLSFAPVADLARGNRAIGVRALHAEPDACATLVQAYVRGMHLAGMAATVKHFPGHGSVREDTHVDAACDPRDLQALHAADLLPFAAAFEAGAEAVMMAHVAYPAIDPRPAGYARVWIEDILRGEMGFGGIVFSDDIGMAAAQSAGGIGARIHAHLDAGCDLVLVCAPALVEEALACVRGRARCDPACLASLRGAAAGSWASLEDNPQRAAFIARLQALPVVDGDSA